MNPEENTENNSNNNDEITIKIRSMDNKEFEVKIKKTLTIKELKEKIEEVNNKFLIYN